MLTMFSATLTRSAAEARMTLSAGGGALSAVYVVGVQLSSDLNVMTRDLAISGAASYASYQYDEAVSPCPTSHVAVSGSAAQASSETPGFSGSGFFFSLNHNCAKRYSCGAIHGNAHPGTRCNGSPRRRSQRTKYCTALPSGVRRPSTRFRLRSGGRPIFPPIIQLQSHGLAAACAQGPSAAPPLL